MFIDYIRNLVHSLEAAACRSVVMTKNFDQETRSCEAASMHYRSANADTKQ